MVTVLPVSVSGEFDGAVLRILNAGRAVVVVLPWATFRLKAYKHLLSVTSVDNYDPDESKLFQTGLLPDA